MRTFIAHVFNLVRYCFLLVLLVTGCMHVYSQPKKIYLANDDHTDYMWTGDEETYRKAFSEMLDYYIKLNDSTANLPYNMQSKWNCDGSYWVYNYKQTRSPAQFDKLVDQIMKLLQALQPIATEKKYQPRTVGY